jgi:hypothetical protein
MNQATIFIVFAPDIFNLAHFSNHTGDADFISYHPALWRIMIN